MALCITCGKSLQRWSSKYCSNKCQWRYQYEVFIRDWKRNDKTVNTKNISGYLKKYLLEEYGEKCSQCGWNKRNPVTNRVPLEVDHLDGRSDNNTEKNLRLVCPNCHALTPTFRNLNKGRGRAWRNKKVELT